MNEGNKETRNNYHRCLTPIQMKFVGQHDEKIKRAIRLLKYWVKTNNHTLKSYAVELLVIRAWEDLGKPHPGSVSEEAIMKLVFDKLRNFGNIQLSWTTYYDPRSFEVPSPPYILDPADPYHNVIGHITAQYWQTHLQAAGRLESAVIQEVSRLERDAQRAFKSFN